MHSSAYWALFVLFVTCPLVTGQRQGRGRHWPHIPHSPCPEIFYYYEDNWSSQLHGALFIPPPQDSTRISISAQFIVPVYLNSEYAGKIELKDDKEYVINRLRQGNRKSIFYSVHFPIQNPLPILTQLTVNDETICMQKAQDINGAYTTLSLSHILTSPTPITFKPSITSEIPDNIGIRFETSPPKTSSQPPLPSTSFPNRKVPLISNSGFIPTPFIRPNIEPVTTTQPFPETEEDCGRPVFTNHLIVEGTKINRGSWPWLAAIFTATDRGQNFQCGGTLISRSHVVTAAHCVQLDPLKPKVIESRDVVIYLGKHNLLDFLDSYMQAKGVSNIKVHPKYGEGISHTDNDIAILFLSSPADYKFNVQPVCLYDSRFQYEEEGKVIGWGKDESGNKVSQEPKLATLPIVSQEQCLRSNRDFLYITSNTTMCAGARDGVGPCNGDSGGGLYTQVVDKPGRWYLRGVVSLSLQDPTTINCDLSHYVVFTDLSKFSEWISSETGITTKR